MAKATHQLKLIWLKTMEKVGNTASQMATSARLKTQELKLEAHKRELLSKLSAAAFRLWQEGESLPAPLDDLLKELGVLEEELEALRAEKAAQQESKEKALTAGQEESPADAAEEERAEDAKEAPAESEAEGPAIPEEAAETEAAKTVAAEAEAEPRQENEPSPVPEAQGAEGEA